MYSYVVIFITDDASKYVHRSSLRTSTLTLVAKVKTLSPLLHCLNKYLPAVLVREKGKVDLSKPLTLNPTNWGGGRLTRKLHMIGNITYINYLTILALTHSCSDILFYVMFVKQQMYLVKRENKEKKRREV